MKFSVLKENLNRALLIVNRVIPVKPQLPVLNNVLLKTGEGEIGIIGTSLETGISVSVRAKIETPGEITLPGRLLTEFVSSLPSEKIDFTLDKEILKVKTTDISATFNTIPAKEFPPFPTSNKKTDLQLSVDQVASCIAKTAFAASIDEGRPVLTGIKVKMEKDVLSFYATDGYRLSIVRSEVKNLPFEKQLIFPARALLEVVRIAQEEKAEMIGLSLLDDKNQAVFLTETSQIVTRLIDGEFPNVEKIVPSSFKTRVVLEKEGLLQSVKIASLFARGASNIIKLKVDKQGMSLMANAPQVGENQDFIDAKLEGEETEIAFNYRFLLDLLNNYAEKEIAFESSGSLNPGVFKPVKEDGSFLHIIMPVRLQG